MKLLISHYCIDEEFLIEHEHTDIKTTLQIMKAIQVKVEELHRSKELSVLSLCKLLQKHYGYILYEKNYTNMQDEEKDLEIGMMLDIFHYGDERKEYSDRITYCLELCAFWDLYVCLPGEPEILLDQSIIEDINKFIEMDYR